MRLLTIEVHMSSPHQWLLDVLDDIQDYAQENKLLTMIWQIENAKQAAREDMGSATMTTRKALADCDVVFLNLQELSKH